MDEELKDLDVPSAMKAIDQTKLSTGKYGARTQRDFEDPVLRCDSCSAMVFKTHLHQLGCCNKCGNRRFRNVLVMSKEEMEILKEKGVDPDYIALFEGVELD